MTCPYCTATLPDGARLCTACGRLIAPTTAPPAPSVGQSAPTWNAPTGTPPRWGPGAPGSGYGSAAGYGYQADVYHPHFDVRQLTPETAAEYRQHRLHATFSVFLTIFLHVMTFGCVSWAMIARKHAFLPTIVQDDFGFRRGFGFLFIPFYNLYWMFVLLHRTVDRLALQTKLWEAGKPPSRGLATALAILNVFGAIPYLGFIVTFLPLPIVWAIVLGQVQATCNRLALAAAPPTARDDMVTLERRMRLRWLGWTFLGPSVTVVVGALLTQIALNRVMPDGIVVSTVFLAFALGGAVMVYRGSLGTREIYHHLSGFAPQIAAGYLRLEKNAAWTVVWLGVILAVLSCVVGISTMADPDVDNTVEQGVTTVGQAVGWLILAGYAFYKARVLKGQIAWLESQPLQ